MDTLSLFQSGDTPLTERGRELVGKKAIELAKLEEKGSLRQGLYLLESAVSTLPPVDFPLQHVFAPGVVARTIQLPKGSIIMGKIHKHVHLNILSSGHVSVVTESGGVEKLTGPLTMTSPAGTKRAVYAHTDAVWTTIHLTNETDLAKIEDEVIAKTYEDYEKFLLGETL
jgi:hypothetical protein